MEAPLSRNMALFEGIISRVLLTLPRERSCTRLGGSRSGVTHGFFYFKSIFCFGMVLDDSRRCPHSVPASEF